MSGNRSDNTIRKYIKYNILLLRIVGLWTDSDDLSRTKYYRKYVVLVNLVTATFNLSQVAYLLLAAQDLEMLASSAYVVMTCALANVKAFICLSQYPLFKRLANQLEREEFQPKNRRQWRQAHGDMRVHIFVQKSYIGLSYAVLAPLWLLSPLFSSERRLPFPAAYPFDWKQPVMYRIAYAHQCVGLILVGGTNILLDLLTMGFVAYVALECGLLADNLRNIYEVTRTRIGGADVRKADFHREMSSSLADCVVHHRMILEFAHDCNQLFGTLLFAQFASSITAICMTNFELSVLSPASLEFAALLVYQLTMFYELMIYCYFGNELIEKSGRISFALYESCWMDLPQSFKKNALFVMTRAQRPMRMFALNLFVLSLATFVSILRTSWSFFVMLRQMHLKNQPMD